MVDDHPTGRSFRGTARNYSSKSPARKRLGSKGKGPEVALTRRKRKKKKKGIHSGYVGGRVSGKPFQKGTQGIRLLPLGENVGSNKVKIAFLMETDQRGISQGNELNRFVEHE